MSSAVASAHGTILDTQSYGLGLAGSPLGLRGTSLSSNKVLATVARANCMTMWQEVTKRGKEKLYLSGENIHLLYIDIKVENRSVAGEGG